MSAFDIKDASTWPSSATVDPEWDELEKSLPDDALNLGMFPDIASLRKFMADAAGEKVRSPPPAGIHEEDRQIPMRDGQNITVRIHRPEQPPSGGSPLYVLYHGGGWCVGSLEDEEPFIRRMVKDFGMTVVNVDYRLAPEYKFPTAHHDCYDATKWAAENATAIGANPSKGFVLGGTSAGANITAFISHLWRDENLQPKLTGCHLMIPATCNVRAVPEKYAKNYQSWDQLEFSPILSRKACDLFLDNYMPNPEDRIDQRLSVLNWETGHGDLPPQYFQICGMDVLRDEALIYERVLREECGVKTKVDVYPGLPHGWWGMFPQLRVSQKFAREADAGVGWLLGQR